MDLETTTTLPDRTVTIHRNKTAAPPLPKQMALGAPHPSGGYLPEVSHYIPERLQVPLRH